MTLTTFQVAHRRGVKLTRYAYGTTDPRAAFGATECAGASGRAISKQRATPTRQDAPVGELIVRKATRQDAAVVGGLNNHVHDLHVAAEPYDFRPTLDSEVEAFFAFILTADNHVVLLGSIEGVAVGYLWAEDQARSASPFKNATRAVSLNHISVDPAYRRRGVGRALYSEAEAEARRRGIDRVVMDHWTFNTDAAAFFESLGFESFNIRMRKLLPTT